MEQAGRPYLPAVKTLLGVGGVLSVALVMDWLARHGDNAEPDFATSWGFRVWIGVAAFTCVVFALTAVRGLQELSVIGRTMRATRRERLIDGVFYLALVGIIVLFQWRGGSLGFGVPLEHWPWLRTMVFGLGAASAGPWVVVVWIAHARLALSKETVLALGPDGRPSKELCRLVVGVREHIQRAVLGLTTLVLGALLTTGALRAALVPDIVEEQDFPPSAVLLYGTFTAGILALAVVPLLASWRGCAGDIVKRLKADESDPELAELRASLASTLADEGSIFRSPLFLVSVLTPLLTSAVTALIPQLGS